MKNHTGQFDYSKVNHNCQLVEKGEIKRPSRKTCPYCGLKTVFERLRPDTPHHSELRCFGCGRFLSWVKEEKSLLNPDGSKRRLQIRAIPFKDRIGGAICRIVGENGEIVCDQLKIEETRFWFESEEEVSKNA